VNYLAHLFVAGDNPADLVGHMLADFLTLREIAAYPPEIRAGIAMHQRVDAFSDDHPVFAASRRRFQPPYRRYGGVLVDLVYDHFLAKHWDEYSPKLGLPEFTQRAYAILQQHHGILPHRLQKLLPHMIGDDWLCSYRELESVGWALRGISHRLRRENPLATALGVLEANYSGLEGDFRVFFPELTAFAAKTSTNGAEGMRSRNLYALGAESTVGRS
jgi:acyl carrier protein phosphodiesterase